MYGLNKVGAMGDGMGMGENTTWATNDGVTYAELDTIQVSLLTHKNIAIFFLKFDIPYLRVGD